MKLKVEVFIFITCPSYTHSLRVPHINSLGCVLIGLGGMDKYKFVFLKFEASDFKAKFHSFYLIWVLVINP